MEWNIFVSTFLVIFLAELPDKTALTILMMATCENPWGVFTGAASAFVIQSIIGAIFGSFFLGFPQKWIHIGSGLLFLIFAVGSWRQRNEIKKELTPKHFRLRKPSFWTSGISSFWVIFIAEWGDLTQMATASLVARYGKPLIICFASIISLWTVTALATWMGHRAKDFLHPPYLHTIAAFVFTGVGLYFIWQGCTGI